MTRLNNSPNLNSKFKDRVNTQKRSLEVIANKLRTNSATS